MVKKAKYTAPSNLDMRFPVSLTTHPCSKRKAVKGLVKTRHLFLCLCMYAWKTAVARQSTMQFGLC